MVTLAVSLKVNLPVFRVEAVIIGLQIFFAFLILTFLGAGFLKIALRMDFADPACSVPLLLATATGQSLLVAWIYLRSTLGQLTSPFIGQVWPIEILLIPVFFTLGLFRGGHESGGKGTACRRILQPFLPTFSFALVAFITISLLELPRETMMSSDPDQHAYFASMVSRFAGVPFSLGPTGDDPFYYPAGFAVLNYVWMALSMLDSRQIVAAQPLIQTQLAVMLCFQFGFSFVKSGNRARTDVSALALALITYYCLLPYGYQLRFFHQEGTGRISMLLLVACSMVSFSFAVEAFRSGKQLSLAFASLVIGALQCFVALTVNPASLIFPGAFFGLSAVAFLLSPGAFLKKIVAVAISGSIILISFCDPYYIKASQEDTGHTTVPEVSASSRSLGEVLSDVSRNWASHYRLLLEVEPLEPEEGRMLLYTLVLSLLLLFPFIRKKLSATAKTGAMVFLCCIALLVMTALAVLPFAETFSYHSTFRLLYPYSMHSAEQMFYLVLMVSGAVVMAGSLAVLPLVWRPVLVSAFVLGMNYLSTNSADSLLAARYPMEGPMGSATSSDRKVLHSIEKKYRAFMEANPAINSSDVPKTLIPNFAPVLGVEKWLFPHGAGRIYPLYDVFPPAFYYFRGKKSLYTVENYQQHVCSSLDIRWLKKYNIKFLFIPSKAGPVCVAGMDKLKKSGDIVFKSGHSYFIRLWN